MQQGCGISHVPSADFALYNRVLETACALGAIPDGYGWSGDGPASLATMFAMARGARGTEAEAAAGIPANATALEMTKWVDTNYHDIVPRLSAGIHSPRVPSAEEMAALLRRATNRIPVERLWVNPDCGLKTRSGAEVRPAMANLIAAARMLRHELG